MLGRNMKKFKAISSVLVISLFVQSIGPVAHAADSVSSPSASFHTASEGSISDRASSLESQSVGGIEVHEMETLSHIVEIQEAPSIHSERAVVVTPDPAAAATRSNYRQDEEIADYRQVHAKFGWKAKVVMGTIFAALLGVGGVMAAWQTGAFGKKPGSDTVPPAPAPEAPSISSIQFSGYDWPVKQGGKNNNFAYTTDAVFLDSDGNLNLQVLKVGDTWKSTEVALNQSLGYGVYEFEVKTSAVSLDTNLVSSSMLYADDLQSMDVQLSKWHDSSAAAAASFGVQPTDVTGNLYPFQPVADGQDFVKYRINWSKEKVLFEALLKDTLIASFSYSGKYNFAPGNETVVLKHWLHNSTMPADQHQHSMVIKSFKFTAQK